MLILSRTEKRNEIWGGRLVKWSDRGGRQPKKILFGHWEMGLQPKKLTVLGLSSTPPCTHYAEHIVFVLARVCHGPYDHGPKSLIMLA